MDHRETGRIIAEARKKRRFTQKQLADRIHVSDRTVSKWEVGKGFPDPSLLEPLSDALQIPIADIVCGRTTKTRPGEELRLREVLAVILPESRRRAVIQVGKKILLGAAALLIPESAAFTLRTGGDGWRRWEWVRYFREVYETECRQYPDRGVYRMEWISGDSRAVLTDAAAIQEVLSLLREIELGKEYRDWGRQSVRGYLTVTTDDGEARDSTFVLSFPAFTISSGIGGEEGRYFCYEAAIGHDSAFDAVSETIAGLVRHGSAAQNRIGIA